MEDNKADTGREVDITFFVPCFNEEENAEKTLAAFSRFTAIPPPNQVLYCDL
jgi:hypothetical protein